MKRLFLPTLFAMALLTSCTAQQRARSFGGTVEINLPPNTKLVSATWKETADLWYLHRPMRAGEVPEVTTFQQEIGGALVFTAEGKVIFRESK
jgi:hypothetical protein